MRYDSQQLQSMLSAEYVLGVQIDPVIRRFEQLMAERTSLRDHVAQWEQRLEPMSAELPPIAPPRRVWRAIETRLTLRDGKSAAKPASYWWPALAATLAAISVALGVQLFRPAPPPATTYLAVVNDEQGQPVWLVQTTPDTAQLRVQAVGKAAPPTGRDHELWLLPGGDLPPISMGLMPASGTLTAKLPGSVLSRLPSAGAIAVSLEPAGGSPTGAPTGPVLYVASLIES